MKTITVKRRIDGFTITTTVSDCDYEWLMQFKWYIGPGTYLIRFTKGKPATILMHREIAKRMGLNLYKTVDHIDGDKHNNTRENLRSACYSKQNLNRKKQKINISGYVGVGYNKRAKKWRASAYKNNKTFHIGYFDTPEIAFKARCLYVIATNLDNLEGLPNCDTSPEMVALATRLSEQSSNDTDELRRLVREICPLL